MSKSTTTYWNPLAPDQRTRWTPIKGLEGIAEEVTLSVDLVTGEYTRLTRFLPGADTSAFGGKDPCIPGRGLHCQRAAVRPGLRSLAGSGGVRKPSTRRTSWSI